MSVAAVADAIVMESANNKPPSIGLLLSGQYGLAVTYWGLYLAGAGAFFLFGSRAVEADRWLSYIMMAGGMLVYTCALVIGVRVTYKGPQLWKVMSRTSSVFMVINILVGISTLGFVG